MTQRTGTSSTTLYFEDGEQVYPCSCGETHRGPYAVYDYGHHNCFHTEPLIRLSDDIDGVEHLMCGQCGKDFSA